MTPILDKAGLPVPNLFIRRKKIYWRKRIYGKSYLRAVPMRPVDGQPTQEQIRSSLSWGRNMEELILRDERDKIDGTKRNRCHATIAELCEHYRRICQANGSPLPATIEANIHALERIIAAAGESVRSSTTILNKDLLRSYQAAQIAAYGDRPATRRTIQSTINQARCITQTRLAQDYTINLPNLQPWREAWLGTAPVKHVALPPYQLRRKTALAARKLWLSRDPMYVVYLLAYQLGMRSDEIAFAKWSWIEDHLGQKRISIRDRDQEGFHIKGVRPGNVPVHPAVIKRLKSVGGDEYIVPGSSYNERKRLIARSFSKWMVALGWDSLDTTKRAHELRRLFGSRVWARYGKEECFQRMRHMSFATTERHYLNLNLDLRRRELAGI